MIRSPNEIILEARNKLKKERIENKQSTPFIMSEEEYDVLYAWSTVHNITAYAILKKPIIYGQEIKIKES